MEFNVKNMENDDFVKSKFKNYNLFQEDFTRDNSFGMKLRNQNIVLVGDSLELLQDTNTNSSLVFLNSSPAYALDSFEFTPLHKFSIPCFESYIFANSFALNKVTYVFSMHNDFFQITKLPANERMKQTTDEIELDKMLFKRFPFKNHDISDIVRVNESDSGIPAYLIVTNSFKIYLLKINSELESYEKIDYDFNKGKRGFIGLFMEKVLWSEPESEPCKLLHLEENGIYIAFNTKRLITLKIKQIDSSFDLTCISTNELNLLSVLSSSIDDEKANIRESATNFREIEGSYVLNKDLNSQLNNFIAPEKLSISSADYVINDKAEQDYFSSSTKFNNQEFLHLYLVLENSSTKTTKLNFYFAKYLLPISDLDKSFKLDKRDFKLFSVFPELQTKIIEKGSSKIVNASKPVNDSRKFNHKSKELYVLIQDKYLNSNSTSLLYYFNDKGIENSIEDKVVLNFFINGTVYNKNSGLFLFNKNYGLFSVTFANSSMQFEIKNDKLIEKLSPNENIGSSMINNNLNSSTMNNSYRQDKTLVSNTYNEEKAIYEILRNYIQNSSIDNDELTGALDHVATKSGSLYKLIIDTIEKTLNDNINSISRNTDSTKLNINIYELNIKEYIAPKLHIIKSITDFIKHLTAIIEKKKDSETAQVFFREAMGLCSPYYEKLIFSYQVRLAEDKIYQANFDMKNPNYSSNDQSSKLAMLKSMFTQAFELFRQNRDYNTEKMSVYNNIAEFGSYYKYLLQAFEVEISKSKDHSFLTLTMIEIFNLSIEAIKQVYQVGNLTTNISGVKFEWMFDGILDHLHKFLKVPFKELIELMKQNGTKSLESSEEITYLAEFVENLMYVTKFYYIEFKKNGTVESKRGYRDFKEYCTSLLLELNVETALRVAFLYTDIYTFVWICIEKEYHEHIRDLLAEYARRDRPDLIKAIIKNYIMLKLEQLSKHLNSEEKAAPHADIFEQIPFVTYEKFIKIVVEESKSTYLRHLYELYLRIKLTPKETGISNEDLEIDKEEKRIALGNVEENYLIVLEDTEEYKAQEIRYTANSELSIKLMDGVVLNHYYTLNNNVLNQEEYIKPLFVYAKMRKQKLDSLSGQGNNIMEVDEDLEI